MDEPLRSLRKVTAANFRRAANGAVPFKMPKRKPMPKPKPNPKPNPKRYRSSPWLSTILRGSNAVKILEPPTSR
jgi:hypothetical protein